MERENGAEAEKNKNAILTISTKNLDLVYYEYYSHQKANLPCIDDFYAKKIKRVCYNSSQLLSLIDNAICWSIDEYRENYNFQLFLCFYILVECVVTVEKNW